MAVDNYQQKIVALDEVTTTTTSQVVPCKGAKKISLLITVADRSSGNAVITVPVSVDDTTYVNCATIVDNLANAITEGPTRVASKTVNADGSTLMALDLDYFTYSSLKVTATVTTDGTYTVTVFMEY